MREAEHQAALEKLIQRLSPEQRKELHAPAQKDFDQLNRRFFMGTCVSLGMGLAGVAAGLVAGMQLLSSEKVVHALDAIDRGVHPAHVISRLSKDETVALCGKILEEVREEPKNPSEHFIFFARVYALSVIDPQHLDPALQVRSDRLFNAFLSDRLDSWQESEKFYAAHGAMQGLYKMLPLRNMRYSHLAEDAIGRLESLVDTASIDEVLKFVDEKLKAVRTPYSNTISGSGDVPRMFITDMSSLDDVEKLLIENGAKRDASGNCEYAYTDSGGSVSRWCFSFQVQSCPKFVKPYIVTVRRSDRPDVMYSLGAEDFEAVVEGHGIAPLIEKALQRSQEEEGSVQDMCTFDFDRQASIVYMRVFPRTYDETMACDLLTSTLRARAVRERYGSIVERPPIVFSDDPLQDIRRDLKARLSRGQRGGSLILDFSAHGDEGYLGYRNPVTAADLAMLVQEFPMFKYTVPTIACYGAGLSEGLQSHFRTDTKLPNQLSLFVQTQSHLVNSLYNGAGSMYDLYLIKALCDPKIPTYGAAADEADFQTRRRLPYDARALIDGRELARAERLHARYQSLS